MPRIIALITSLNRQNLSESSGYRLALDLDARINEGIRDGIYYVQPSEVTELKQFIIQNLKAIELPIQVEDYGFYCNGVRLLQSISEDYENNGSVSREITQPCQDVLLISAIGDESMIPIRSGPGSNFDQIGTLEKYQDVFVRNFLQNEESLVEEEGTLSVWLELADGGWILVYPSQGGPGGGRR